jgi:hypothetical protein
MALIEKIKLDSGCYLRISTSDALGLDLEQRRNLYKISSVLSSSSGVFTINNRVIEINVGGKEYSRLDIKDPSKFRNLYSTRYYVRLDDILDVADKCTESLIETDNYQEFLFHKNFNLDALEENLKWHFFAEIRIYSPEHITLYNGDSWVNVDCSLENDQKELEFLFYDHRNKKSLKARVLQIEKYNNLKGSF